MREAAGMLQKALNAETVEEEERLWTEVRPPVHTSHGTNTHAQVQLFMTALSFNDSCLITDDISVSGVCGFRVNVP